MPDYEARIVFPRILKAYMDREKLSQVDLAEKLNTSKQTVSDWVNGKKFPRVDRMQQLANLFGVLMSDLYVDKSASAPNIEESKEDRLLSAYRHAEPKYQEIALELLEEHPAKKEPSADQTA